MNFIDLIKKLVNEGEVEDSTIETLSTLDSSDAATLSVLRSSETKLAEQAAKYVSGVGFFDASESKKPNPKVNNLGRQHSSGSRNGTRVRNSKESEEPDRD